MRSLVYVSTATEPFDSAALEALVESCRRFNQPNGVTGCLIYNGLNFMQAVEGEESVIAGCIDRILADTRHRGVIIIRDIQIETREFPEWAMVGRLVPDRPDDATRERMADMLSDASEDTKRLFFSFATLKAL